MIRKLRSLRVTKKEVFLEQGAADWRKDSLEGKLETTIGPHAASLKKTSRASAVNSEEMMWVFSFSLCMNTQNGRIVNKYVDCCFVRVYYV